MKITLARMCDRFALNCFAHRIAPPRGGALSSARCRGGDYQQRVSPTSDGVCRQASCYVQPGLKSPALHLTERGSIELPTQPYPMGFWLVLMATQYIVVPEKLDFQTANDLNAASSMWQTLKIRCIEMPN